MAPIVTRDSPATSLSPDVRTICHVCQKQFAQYTCPRCNARYCSLHCYKGHGVRCTESFMRENVMEEMKMVKPEDSTKRKMLDILKRFHSEEEMDHEVEEQENDSTLSEETIQKFLSGENIRFEDLSVDEMKHFQRAVASGQLSKMIDPWEPWWLKPCARTICLSQDGTQLVMPIDEHEPEASPQSTEESGTASEIPAGTEAPIPPLSKLTRADPSPLLIVHLVDVVYSYCFTLRLYNGDWHCDPSGAAMVVLSISSVLGEGGQPETVAEALSNCLEKTCSPIYRHAGGFQFALGLMDDVAAIFSLDTNALICLLCDLRRLLLYGEKMLKSEKTKAKSDGSRSKIRFAERKSYFLMCWAHEQPKGFWSCIESAVRMEKTSLASVVELDFKNSKIGGKQGEGGSNVLVQEI